MSADAHAADGHRHADGRDDDAHCATCTAGHVMVACLAIAASAIIVVLARRILGRTGSGPLDGATGTWLRRLAQPLRPPDPAWVRLAVMRC